MYTSIPSTNNVYKQSSTHKRLMEDFHFCAVFVNATCTEFSKPFKTVVRRCSEVAWPATLVKRRLLHRCFYVNFYEFLRAPDLLNICKQLLLKSLKMYRYFQKQPSRALLKKRCSENMQ